MRSLFITLILAALPAFAEEKDLDRKYEFEASPYLGYSNYSGFNLGSDLNLSIPLNGHWQWRVGGGFVAKKHGWDHEIRTGANYNFSDDWSHSFYLGAGAGYGNLHPFGNYREERAAKAYAYAQFGKRLTLNKAGTVTWNPHIDLNMNSFKHGHVQIYPLSFGWNF